MTGYIKSGIQEGATVHLGAGTSVTPLSESRREELEEGYFVQPTIFTNVHPQMKIVREEIFGPVSAIIKFSTEQGLPVLLLRSTVAQRVGHWNTEVIDAANDTEYGLACHLFTENMSRAVRVAHAIEAGTSWVGANFYFTISFCFLGTESGILLSLSGQLRRVGTRSRSFWGVQAVRGREAVREASVGHVRSFSFYFDTYWYAHRHM